MRNVPPGPGASRNKVSITTSERQSPAAFVRLDNSGEGRGETSRDEGGTPRRPTVLPSIVQDETRVFSSSAIEKLVFIAPLRPGLNHRCSHNFVVSRLGTAHPIPSQAADLLSNIS
ncbi:hypothetical protein ALC60_05998 [Trachymyrmex zeteki]|uniref:Uncharacterized protein n=1 Tax=Mycetomoellerius zeteki TaxID=64791 RepID=A0A151X3Z3_9HYME|nr:hypothetical protein ALC60_05998 [Trachymyrmex zeteki]